MNRSDGIEPLEPLVALGIDGITGVHPVSDGMDTLIWRVETVHGTYALRLFQPNQRDQYWREIRAMEIVGTLGVPVPRLASTQSARRSKVPGWTGTPGSPARC